MCAQDCTRLKMKPEGLTTANKRAPKYKWWTSPTFNEEGVVDVSDMLTEEELAESNEGADCIVPTDVPIESDPTDPDQTAGSAEAAVQSALDEEDSDSSGDDADGPGAARPYGVPLVVRESTHTPAAVAAGRSPKILVKTGDSDQLVLVYVARFVSDWWKTQQYDPHASSDRLHRLSCGASRGVSATDAMHNACGEPETVVYGDTAALIFYDDAARAFSAWIGDLGVTTTVKIPKRLFSYIRRGASGHVVTHWRYWKRLLAHPSTEAAVGRDGALLPVDLDDPAARYSREGMLQNEAVKINTSCKGCDKEDCANESLYPVLLSFVMEPCDPATCCGRCASIPVAVLETMREWIKERGD